jgi:NDP-sugar pyrophosphorylase family protein
MHILIPAAGIGRRMKSFGPKALIPLKGGERVLTRQLRLLKAAFPSGRFVVVIGFEADRLRRVLPEEVRVVRNEDYDTTNVAHSLCLGLRHCGGEVLIVYADLVFTGRLTAALAGPGSRVLVRPRPAGPDKVGVSLEGERVLHFAHGLGLPWAQVALLRGRELALFRKAVAAEHRRRHFTHEPLNEVLDAGGEVTAGFVEEGQCVVIDSSADIERARKIA